MTYITNLKVALSATFVISMGYHDSNASVCWLAGTWSISGEESNKFGTLFRPQCCSSWIMPSYHNSISLHLYIYTLISLCVCVLIIVDQKYISHSIPLPPSPNCRLLNFSCRSASCFCRQSCVAPGFTRAERCWSWREVRTCRTEQETLQKERFHLGQFGLHPTDCCTYGDFPMEKWRCHPIEKKIRIWLIDFFGFDQSKWKNSPFTMQRLRFAFHHCRDLSSFLKSRVFQWKRSLWPIQMRGGVHPNRMRVGRQSPTDIGEATMTGGWSLKNSLKRGQS